MIWSFDIFLPLFMQRKINGQNAMKVKEEIRLFFTWNQFSQKIDVFYIFFLQDKSTISTIYRVQK